jgi:hypothetical protein
MVRTGGTREPLRQRVRTGPAMTASRCGSTHRMTTVSSVTVAVAVKVYDGIVLAADSATTFGLNNGSHQVYNNANKVFHLHRDLPLGAMTWGVASVGDASIATIAKVLRRRLMGQDPDHTDWALNPMSYTVEEVAKRFSDLVFQELDGKSAVSPTNALGLLVAGYSAGEMLSEAWLIDGSVAGKVPKPSEQAARDQAGWYAYAQGHAVARMIKGYDPSVMSAVKGSLTAAQFAKVKAAVDALPPEELQVVPAMPFADAIKLAEYMVDTTVGYARFRLGPDTVGGPVEVAGVSKFEGFKWISRKHYYSADLNPGGPT